MDTVEVKSHELCMDTVHDLGVGKVSEAGLDVIAQLPHGPGDEMFCTKLNEILLKLEGDPIFSMLELQLNPEETLAGLFKAIKTEISEHPNPQVKCYCVCLLGKGATIVVLAVRITLETFGYYVDLATLHIVKVRDHSTTVASQCTRLAAHISVAKLHNYN